MILFSTKWTSKQDNYTPKILQRLLQDINAVCLQQVISTNEQNETLALLHQAATSWLL